MPRYCVNATMSVPAWVFLEADNADDALEEARELSVRDYDFDTFAGEIEFNVTPIVELDA